MGLMRHLRWFKSSSRTSQIVHVACEAAEDSSYFNRQFDAIISWGLMFLLPEETQEIVIQKMANALVRWRKTVIYGSFPEA
jgi:chemotaxis methyl-accepting protein methylase